MLLTRSSLFVGRSATNGVLDPLELADPAQRPSRYRRGVGLVDIEKLAPDMGPVCDLGDCRAPIGAVDIKLIEGGPLSG